MEVIETSSPGRSWRLCKGKFAGFSPDGRRLLSTREGDLIVHAAREVPDTLRAQGWESNQTVLYTATQLDADRTVVVRCAIDSGRCRTVVSYPIVNDEWLPRPVPPALR